jgi:transcription antitermination factor NusG
MDMNWYVVYTKPGSEQKMLETLKRKKFENYCPVNSIPKKYGDIRKVKETPLFKGFVFVKIRDLQPEELRKINGVVNMVYWLGKPVSVKNGEIKAIRLFLRDYKNITIEKTEIKNNDRINTH